MDKYFFYYLFIFLCGGPLVVEAPGQVPSLPTPKFGPGVRTNSWHRLVSERLRHMWRWNTWWVTEFQRGTRRAVNRAT